jgi:Outer membrane lipoprotein-sorting protein
MRSRTYEAGVIGALLVCALSTAAVGATATELLERADAAWHVVHEGSMRIRATVTTETEPATVTTLDVYVRGVDHVLCVFRDGKQQGRRILVVGDRVWLLVPGAKHAIPISASQRLLGGASVADVARLSFASDFDGQTLPDDETVDRVPCRVVELTRKSPATPYASGKLWVGRVDGLPRRARLSLRSGKEAKEILFAVWEPEDGRMVPRRIEIRHLLRAERGTVTTLEMSHYERRALDPELFDPQGAAELP